MSLKIYPVQKQVKGDFNGGEILENKPIQLTHDPSTLQPYSNIFYWAHAWAETTSTIGLHPHKAFEILSFVLEGSIEHYDTKNKMWIPLKAGDVQIIRAGNGISHAEKVLEGGHIFQIWFDPDISKSLNDPATYDDYASELFPVVQENGMSIKILKGKNSPMQMNTPEIGIKQIQFGPGDHKIALEESLVHSIYLIDGEIDVEAGKIFKDDFILAEKESEFIFSAPKPGLLFMISSPPSPEYETYAQMSMR